MGDKNQNLVYQTGNLSKLYVESSLGAFINQQLSTFSNEKPKSSEPGQDLGNGSGDTQKDRLENFIQNLFVLASKVLQALPYPDCFFEVASLFKANLLTNRSWRETWTEVLFDLLRTAFKRLKSGSWSTFTSGSLGMPRSTEKNHQLSNHLGNRSRQTSKTC